MKNKLPFFILIIVSFIVIIVGLIFILNKDKNTLKENKDLSVQYIGNDKFIGQSVSSEDFKVVYLPNNQTLNPNEYMVENVALDLNGTPVSIMYTTPDGKMVSTEIMVYPTLTINSIHATLQNTDKYIGSTLYPEDFKVIALDNKENEYEITNFTISPNIIEEEETNIIISYEWSNKTFTSEIHVKTEENYFKELNVQFVGTKNYIGQSVSTEDFVVKAIYADNTELEISDFKIVNPLLREEKTMITISAKNSRDEIVTKDIEVEGKNYVNQICSILYIGDAQTVGNTINIDDFEIYGLKSDNTKTKLQGCKIESGSKLESTSNAIRISYYNELGNLLYGDAIVKADDNIIFIGDCRVAEMETQFAEKSKDVIYYIFNDNANLEWFRDVAIPTAQEIMNKNIYTTFRVVINLGLFDSEREGEYAELYRNLASDKWAKHKIFILSLNPIDEEQMDISQIYSRDIINTAKIKEFNINMSVDLGTEYDNLKYVNTNGSIINNGYKTIDGINYDEKTLTFYYNLIKSMTY